METPTGLSSLLPPTSSYWDYFSCAETDTYSIDHADSTDVAKSADAARLVYAAY